MEEEVSVRTTVGLARSWKKEEREKEEASHAHVITNAAGIHDPTSPRPSTSKCHDVAPFLPLLPFPPGPRGMYNVHVLNGGPTTKQEERKTFSNSASIRSSFTEPTQHPVWVRERKGTNEKARPMHRLGYVQTLVCCLVLLKTASVWGKINWSVVNNALPLFFTEKIND